MKLQKWNEGTGKIDYTRQKKETPRFVRGILQKKLGGWSPVDCAVLNPAQFCVQRRNFRFMWFQSTLKPRGAVGIWQFVWEKVLAAG